MSDSVLNKFLRTVKVFYEDILHDVEAGQRGIDQFLFGTDDFSTSAEFTLDRYIHAPHGVVFRKADEQAHARPYNPGVGEVYSVPRASEVTTISEALRDAVVVGIEETTGYSSHNAKLVQDIIKDHTIGHMITRWKLAIDTIRTGIFTPIGAGGVSIGENIDFNRNAAQSITYDFTDSSATIDGALKEMYDQGTAANMGKANRIIILGPEWLQNFETDENVLERMQANPSNVLVEQNMLPPLLQNVKGLYVVARYRIPGTVSPVWLCSFSPDGLFTPYRGATAVDFFPSDEALMIGLDATRYRIFRGLDVLDGGGNIIRTVGEIVFDNFTSDDPVADYLRSSTRYAMVPADIDKTVLSTGTFPAVS